MDECPQPRRAEPATQQQAPARPRAHLIPWTGLLDHPLLIGTTAGRRRRKQIIDWYSKALATSVSAQLHDVWTAQLIARTADAMAAAAIYQIDAEFMARLK